MSVVARRIRATPERSASETWRAIVDLLAPGNGSARVELMSIEGIASSIISTESPKESPIVVKGEGPRIRIYFVDATVRLQFPFAPGGPIFFNSKIHEFEMLRELVTHYATKHSIPIFDHRSGGPGERVDRL